MHQHPCLVQLTVGGKSANLDRMDTSSSGALRSHFFESPHPGGVAHRFSNVSVRIQDRFLGKNSVQPNGVQPRAKSSDLTSQRTCEREHYIVTQRGQRVKEKLTLAILGAVGFGNV